MDYSKYKDLRNIYLENNKLAKAGKATIDRYIKRKDEKGLLDILRSHKERGITNSETWIRDEVDYFIEYFSIVSLGLIVGFIPKSEAAEMEPEVIPYLGNKAVYRYYYINYPLTLPQVLLEAITKHRYFELNIRNKAKINSEFQSFHALNQTIDNDDVNQFLWFLDGGRNDGYDIDDVKQSLRDTSKAFEIAQQKTNNALRQSIRGFFDYLIFLEKFKEFLKAVKSPVHQSAYWTYHEYWFTRIRKKLQSSIIAFHTGLQAFTNKSVNVPQTKKQDITNQIVASRQNYESILNELLFTDRYSQTFKTYISNWRKN